VGKAFSNVRNGVIADTEVILTQRVLSNRSGDPKTVALSLPADERYYVGRESDGEQASPTTYKSLVGGLLFIARMARPEISIHINLLRRRAPRRSPPSIIIFEFDTPGRLKGVRLRRLSDLVLRIYADASYSDKGESPDNLRTTTDRMVGTPGDLSGCGSPVDNRGRVHSELGKTIPNRALDGQ